MQPRRKKVRKRGRTFRRKLTYGIIVAVFFSFLLIYIVSSHYNFFTPSSNQPPGSQESPPKAAIVDQLSFFPDSENRTFVETSTTTLKTAGFTVDYYNGTDVTVECYRNIFSHGYALIVLRVHSALEYSENETTGNVDLFTSELYNETKAIEDYYGDVLDDRVVKAYFTSGGPSYFGISPKFVEHSGQFDNATIVMMGCDGLTYNTMAEAFIKKGAKVYIGWDGPVTSAHSDKATVHLLRTLVTEKQTVTNAITETMNQVGLDPSFGCKLSFYPLEAKNHVIPIGSMIGYLYTPRRRQVSSLNEQNAV